MVRPTLVSCLFGLVAVALITPASAQSTADSDNKEHSLILNPPQRASDLPEPANDSQDRPIDNSSPNNPPQRTTSAPVRSGDAALDQPPRPADYRAPVEENLPPPNRPVATTSSRKPFLIPNQATPASRTDYARDRQVSAAEYRSATPRSASETASNLLNGTEQARFESRAGLRSDFGATFDPESRSGAAVDYVERDSPAYYAGLRRDDLVVGLNGQQVDTGRDAIDIIESLRPGQRVDIEFFRHSNAQLVLSDPMARADDRFIDERPSERISPDRLTSTSELQRQQNLNTYRDNRPPDDRDQRDRRTGIRRLLPRLRD